MLYGLSDDDIAVLREIMNDYKNDVFRGPVQQRDSGPQSPENYVVLTPANGIPARSGTTAGSATCDVYALEYTGGGTSVVLVDLEYSEVVYNVSTIIVPGSSYKIVVRERFGFMVTECSCVS